MPLFVPATGGIDRKRILTLRNVFGDGADTGIEFNHGAVYDAENNQAIIGGDSSFIGFMSDIMSGKIVESAALPNSSGALISDCDRVRLNYNEGNFGEIMVSDPVASQACAISADGGASWTDIGQNGRAFPIRDVCSWRDQLMFLFSSSTNCDLSTDNGATFPTTFDIPLSGPSPTTQFLVTNPDQDILIATSNTGISTFFDDDPTVLASWNNTDFSAMGVTSGWTSIAFPDDMSSGLAISISGRIFHTEDFITWTQIPIADNIFLNGSTPTPSAPDTAVFVDAFDGYVIYGDAAAPSGIVGFIAASDLTTMLAGTFIGTLQPTVLNAWGISDGENVFIGATANDVVCTLPE